eukprot:4134083-Karenia_brevis.AAC.1
MGVHGPLSQFWKVGPTTTDFFLPRYTKPVRQNSAGRWKHVAATWKWNTTDGENYNTLDGLLQLGGDGQP